MFPADATIGIATLVLLGSFTVAVASWLSYRRDVRARTIGRGLAVVIAVYCGFVAFALVADNVDARPRLAGVIVTGVFAVTSVVSLRIVWNSLAAWRRTPDRR